MSDTAKSILVALGILLLCVVVGSKLAKISANQSKSDCYEYGKVTNQEVKFEGDGRFGGPQYGCFVKNGDTWSQE